MHRTFKLSYLAEIPSFGAVFWTRAARNDAPSEALVAGVGKAAAPNKLLENSTSANESIDFSFEGWFIERVYSQPWTIGTN